jgi:hypothetical protein
MRKIIFSIATVALVVAGLSLGSMIQAASRPTTAQLSGTLSPHDMMVKLGKDVPVEKWDHLF